jgi:hypothetical protein
MIENVQSILLAASGAFRQNISLRRWVLTISVIVPLMASFSLQPFL